MYRPSVSFLLTLIGRFSTRDWRNASDVDNLFVVASSSSDIACCFCIRCWALCRPDSASALAISMALTCLRIAREISHASDKNRTAQAAPMMIIRFQLEARVSSALAVNNWELDCAV